MARDYTHQHHLTNDAFRADSIATAIHGAVRRGGGHGQRLLPFLACGESRHSGLRGVYRLGVRFINWNVPLASRVSCRHFLHSWSFRPQSDPTNAHFGVRSLSRPTDHNVTQHRDGHRGRLLQHQFPLGVMWPFPGVSLDTISLPHISLDLAHFQNAPRH